ncbi:YcnI family protein [Gordonia sp. ABSL1-1]|uniref:YcnI family copper-binding membrane protein n=1 Tax=Gordonia sp. ABSL1-1 TaxID=3053923 RepID=UPI0025728CFE|nr:YcnI family protein [Gordonia sp. ABSL1-1]MDL9937792.1 YcnI family protein [Gordonia sp. ABSL1-1]
MQTVSRRRRANPSASRRAVLAGATVSAIGLLSVPGIGAAHVSVEPGSAPAQGGYGQVRLVVPSESDTGVTQAITVTLPDGVNLTAVRTLPVPGWSARIERAPGGASQRVARIVWTADTPDAGLGATEYGVFAFAGGPWPVGADEVALPTEQQYSTGEVVRWDEVSVDDHTEAESPAPVVRLGEPAPSDGSHGGDTTAGESSGHDSDDDGGEAIWRVVAVAGLLLAIGAWVVALRARRVARD